MAPGIQHEKIEFLKTESENNLLSDFMKCAIVFDEVALSPTTSEQAIIDGCEDLGNGRRTKDIADHALTFMIQGVSAKMNHVIAYYFIKSPLKAETFADLITEVIRALVEVDYEVVAMVCDHALTNIKAIELLSARSQSNHSHYFIIDDMKIYVIYDVSQLYLSIRNDFREDGEIILGDRKAVWAHLIQLEAENIGLYELSKLHLNPTGESLEDPILAIQLLSRKVAGFLYFYGNRISSESKTEIMDSAKVIIDLDMLYNCTTGPWGKESVCKGTLERVGNKTFHHKKWLEYIDSLKTLCYPNLEGDAKMRSQRCVDCYISNLLALQEIWKYMKRNLIASINLRSFNLELLQRTFVKINKYCPTKEKPTCEQFCLGLKEVEQREDRRRAQRKAEREANFLFLHSLIKNA